MEESQKNGIQSFNKICLDTTPRERIPSVVTSVPALVFAGKNQCVQGENAFKWLSQEIHAKQQAAQRSKQLNPSASHNATAGEPLAWHSTEMGSSLSDSYSFIDNSFTESGAGNQAPSNNGGGSTIPKNFEFLQNTPQVDVMQNAQPTHSQHNQQRPGMPSGHGRMPPLGNTGMSQSSFEQDELSQRMEQFKMSRDTEAPATTCENLITHRIRCEPKKPVYVLMGG